MSISFVLVPWIILMVLLCTVVPVLLAVFVYRDAKARGMEPLLWTLLAVFAPGFIGLIVYLVVRRDHFKLMCPQCGNEVQQGFVSCPNCGQKLSANCSNCGTALRPEWKLCPQCGNEVTPGQSFASPIMVKPNNKGLGVAIAAILALPLAFIFFAIVAFAGLRFYNTSGGSETGIDSDYEAKTKIALEDFSQASHYVELEVLTLQEAEPDKEITNWVKEKQNGKEGVYARTFFKAENGNINTDNGSGTYALTYACTVVVVNSPDGMAYAPTGYDVTHCEGIDNALLLENVTVFLDSDQKSDSQPSEFGNVFVIRHAYEYSLDYQSKGETMESNYYEANHQISREFTDDDGETVMYEVYDNSDEEPYSINIKLTSGKDSKGATYEIPIRQDEEYYSALK